MVDVGGQLQGGFSIELKRLTDLLLSLPGVRPEGTDLKVWLPFIYEAPNLAVDLRRMEPGSLIRKLEGPNNSHQDAPFMRR